LITLSFIIAFIFCSAITAAAIMIGYNLITTYSNRFLRSYFYYLITFYAFAFYGLWAQLLVRFGLNTTSIDSDGLGLLTNFLPALGMPFLIISWIMLIKMASHLCEITIGLKKEIIIHLAIIVLSALIVSSTIFMFTESYWSVSNWLPVIPFTGLFVMETIYFLVYVIKTSTGAGGKRKNLLYYNFLLLGALVLRITLFIVVFFYPWFLPVAITLYFLTNLIPLIYLWRKSDEEFLPFQTASSSSEKLETLVKKFGISKREQEIIKQISLGMTNQQIADKLFISLQTVKDHTHRIYRKTGVNSRMKLITLLS